LLLFRRKIWLLLLGIVCIAVAFSAFFSSNSRQLAKNGSEETDGNSSPNVAETEGSQKTIKVAAAMPLEEFQVLEQLNAAYQTSRYGVKVKLENIKAKDVYGTLKKAAQLGEAPDVMLLDNLWLSEFAALGYLFPLDSILTNDVQAQQLEQALAQVKWNGYIWGIPKDIDVPVMAYSKKRLSELARTSPPETAEDLLSLHKAAHMPAEKKYGIYFDWNDTGSFVTLASLLGGPNTAAERTPLRLQEPALVRSLESFLAVPEGGKADLEKSFPETGESWNPWVQLENGNAAGYLTLLSAWKRNGSEALLVTALPLPEGQTLWEGSWIQGRSFSIYARSDYPKEAFDWIREMTSPQAAVRFWEAGGRLPAQPNAYTDAIKGDEAVQKSAVMIDQDRALSGRPYRMKQMSILAEKLERLRKGELTVKEFAEQTETAWTANGQGY
jgi:multiple sugar transport system substrate-binding protein